MARIEERFHQVKSRHCKENKKEQNLTEWIYPLKELEEAIESHGLGFTLRINLSTSGTQEFSLEYE